MTEQEDGVFVQSSIAPNGSERVLANCRRAKAILLTYDCVLDKPDTKFWQICPVVPIAKIARADQGLVRKNRIFHYLHLPAFGNELPESFVDFSIVTTIEPGTINCAHRIVTLSDVGRKSFYGQYIRSITRWELKSAQCPACSTEFDISLSLPVRPE